jgi:hypothetical protein
MKTSIKYIGTFLFGVLASFLGLVVWGDTDGSELTLRSSSNVVGNSLAPTPKPLLPVDDNDISQYEHDTDLPFGHIKKMLNEKRGNA